MTDANADIRIRGELDDRIGAGLQRLNQQLNGSIRSLSSFKTVLSNLNSSSQDAVAGIVSLNKNTNSLRATVKGAAENQKLLQIAFRNSAIQAQQLNSSMQTLSKAGYSTAGLKAYRSQLQSTVLIQNELNNTMRAAQWGRMSTQLTGFSQRVSQAGMRVSMGLTVPLLAFFRIGFSSLKSLDREIVRSNKLIGDSYATATKASSMAGTKLAKDGKSYTQMVDGQVKTFRTLEGAISALGSGLDSLSQKWGVSRELLQGVAGDFAEIGISAPEALVELTTLTAEFEKLGNVDITQAQATIQSLFQTVARVRRDKGMDVTSDIALKQMTEEIRGAVAFFNFAENKTTLSLKNIADAFPEVTAAATSFGLSIQSTAAMLVPMIGAGFQVGASANSIKVSLQRMVVTTKQNKEIIGALTKALGKDFVVGTEIGAQGIQDLVDSYIGMKKIMGDKGTLEFFGRMFGVRQGPRMDTSIRQMSQFQEQMNNANSQESKLTKNLENSINARMDNLGLQKVEIKNFKQISDLNLAAQESDKAGNYTLRAKAIQEGQAAEVKQMRDKNSVGEEFNKITTETGKLLLGQAFGKTISAETMKDELKKAEGLLEVKFGKAREAFKSISRDLTLVFGSILDALNPVITKISSFISDMSPAVKKLIGIVLVAIAVIGPLMRGIGVFAQIGSVFARARQGGINAFRGTVVQLNSSLLQTNDLVLRLGGNFTKVGESGKITTSRANAKNIARLSPLYSKQQAGETLSPKEQAQYKKSLTGLVGKEAMKRGTALGRGPGSKKTNYNVEGLDLASKEMLLEYQNQVSVLNQAVAVNVQKMNRFKNSLNKISKAVTKVFNIKPPSGGGAASTAGAAPIYPTPTGAAIPTTAPSVAAAPSAAVAAPIVTPLRDVLLQILTSIQAIQACVCNAKAAATGRPSPAASGAPTNAPPFYPTPTGAVISAATATGTSGPTGAAVTAAATTVTATAAVQKQTYAELLATAPYFQKYNFSLKDFIAVTKLFKLSVQDATVIAGGSVNEAFALVKAFSQDAVLTKILLEKYGIDIGKVLDQYRQAVVTARTGLAAGAKAGAVPTTLPAGFMSPAGVLNSLKPAVAQAMRNVSETVLLSIGAGPVSPAPAFIKIVEPAIESAVVSAGAVVAETIIKDSKTKPKAPKKSPIPAAVEVAVVEAEKVVAETVVEGAKKKSKKPKGSANKVKAAAVIPAPQPMPFIGDYGISYAKTIAAVNQSVETVIQQAADSSSKATIDFKTVGESLSKVLNLQKISGDVVLTRESLVKLFTILGQQVPEKLLQVSNLVDKEGKVITTSLAGLGRLSGAIKLGTTGKALGPKATVGSPVTGKSGKSNPFYVQRLNEAMGQATGSAKVRSFTAITQEELSEAAEIEKMFVALEKQKAKVLGLLTQAKTSETQLELKINDLITSKSTALRSGKKGLADDIQFLVVQEQVKLGAVLDQIDRLAFDYRQIETRLDSIKYQARSVFIEYQNILSKKGMPSLGSMESARQQAFAFKAKGTGAARGKRYVDIAYGAKRDKGKGTEEYRNRREIHRPDYHPSLESEELKQRRASLAERRRAGIVAAKKAAKSTPQFMGIDPSAELARKAAIQEARTKNLETQKRITEGAPGASPVITKKMTEQDYLRINAKDAQEQSTLIEQLSKKTLRLKKNIEETMAATRVAGGKKTALAALRRELRIVNDELGAAEERLKTLTTMPEIAGYPKKKGRGGQPTLGKSHKMRLGSAPDISSEMKPKSLSAAAASGATILGEINAQVGASLQLPTNVLDQFLQTLKIQGKGLAEVATRSGFQATDEMALLKDSLSKIGVTVEQALAKPAESLKALQAVKFEKSGEVQDLFQRLVMFARDVANKGVETAFQDTIARFQTLKPGAAPTKAVAPATTSALFGSGMTRDERKAAVEKIKSQIITENKAAIDFYNFELKTLQYAAQAFGLSGAGKKAEIVTRIHDELTKMGITVEKAIVTDAVKPITKAAKVVTEASTAIAPSTADETAAVVTAGKELGTAVEKTVKAAADTIKKAAGVAKNPYLASIKTAGPALPTGTSVMTPYSRPGRDRDAYDSLDEFARIYGIRTEPRPVSALPDQLMSPLGVINAMKPVAPSIPEASTKGKLREILAIRIAEKAAMEERIRNNVRISQSIRAVREAARAANIESVRLPMPIVRAKASGVTLSEQTRERLRIARGATDESSISSVPIPSRPSRRADRTSLTRDQFVGQTMLGGVKAVASPLATVKAIGSAIRLAASTAEKIATRLNPANFAKMSVYKPRDYVKEARAEAFVGVQPTSRLGKRLRSYTGGQRNPIITERYAKIAADKVSAADRPSRGVRVLTQSQLPSQFRQTLDPSIQAVKAIANTYGPPLTKALGVAKTRSIQGMKIAGQVAQQIAILPVRVPQIFTTVMDEMHRRVAPLVIKPILKGADALMTGLRAGIAKLESMPLKPTSVGTYVLQVAKVLETSLVQVGNVSVKAASLLPVVGKALVSASDIATNAIITAFINPRQALLMASSSITSGSAIASSFIRKSAVTLRTAFLSIPSLTSSALTLAGNGLMIGAKKVATGAKSLAAATGRIAMMPVRAPMRGMFGVGATPTTDASGNTVKSGGFFRKSTITAPGGAVTRGPGMLGRMGGALGGGIRGLGGMASSMSGMMLMQLGPAGMALQGPLTKVISLLTKTKGAFFGVTAPIMLVVGAIFILKKTFKAWESSSMGVVDNFKLAWKSISNIIGTLKAVFFDFFASLFGNSKKTDGATKSIGSAMTKVAKTVREVAQAIEKFFNGVVKSALYSFAAGLSLIIRGVVEFVMNVFKFVKALVGFFRGGGQASKDAMNNAWHGMLEGFRKAIKGIAKALHPFLSLLILAVQKVVALIVQIFEFMVIGVVNLIRLMVKGIINLTFTIVKAYVFVIDKIIDVFVFLEKKAIDIVAFLVKGVIKVFFGIIDGVLFVVQKIIEVFGLIPSGIGIIMEKAVGIMAKALGGISWLARKVGLDSLADGIDKFAQSAKDFTSDVVTFGRDTALSIVKSVRSGIGAAEDAATGLVDNVAEKMKKLVSGIGSAGDVIGRVLQGVQNKLLDGVDGAADAVNSFIGGFSDAINSAGDDVRDWLRGLVDGDEITEGIGRQIQDAAGEGVRDPSAAEAAGKTIADAIGKGLSDLKANFYDKVISNLSDSLGKLKDQITKALEKQKDQSLKFFDDQIAAIDALAAADAELTAEKQKQEDERLRIAERALQRDSYIKNRALAIYEGRIEDARTMGLEEAKNQQDFNKETEKNAKEAQLAAKAKNIDTAKKVIENQKQTASVQFDKDLEDFQLFIENIGKYGTLTKDELTSQFNELRAKADQTSGGMQAAFQGYYNALPGLIEKNTDPTVGFFTSSMDALIAGASLKYGLDTGAKDPSTMLGLTNAMMGNLGTVYTNGFTDTVVPAYSEGQNLIKGIADEFADPSTANPKSAAGIYATAIANATIAVKAEFMKMKTEAGSAFAQVVIAINDELKNLAVSKAISDAKEELKNVTKTPTPTVTVPAPVAATPSPTPAPEAPSSEPSTGTESPASAPSPSPVSLRSGAKGIVKEAFEKALGSDKLFKSGDSHEYIKKAKEALSFYGYSGFSSGSGEYGVSTTAAMKAFQKTYKADNVTGNLGVESANMLGLFSNDGVQKKYNGGMIKRMIGGIVPGFSNQGVPALLHGGEYVINAKAVQNIGLSVLGQLNGMKNGIPSINVPKPQMPNSSGMNVNVTSHSQSETIHNYNFTVDNFIGEDRWFESMMKEYNVKVVPNNQKAAGLESRVVRTYNGINKGM